MTVNPLKETTYLPDETFPINIFQVHNGIPPHWHDHMEWIVVREGRVRVQFDAEKAIVREGEVVFIGPKQLHSAAMLEPGTRITAIVIGGALIRNSGLDSTEGRYFAPMLSQKLALPNVFRADDPQWDEIRRSVQVIVDEFERKDVGFELLIKAELFRFFGLLFRQHRQLSSHPSPRGLRESEFTRLLQDLRSRFNSVVTVAEAAERVNMSPTYFCRRFKQVTGKTLVEYMQALRVNEAERLLRETDEPVTAIAEQVGFGSITYFGRVFRAYKHCSPTEARLRGR